MPIARTDYDVLDYLASGMSVEEILRDFPELTHEGVRACLAYAADGERSLMSVYSVWVCRACRLGGRAMDPDDSVPLTPD